ncbi:MAG: hypothetical protein KDK48_06800 [Chlamydiia bacterium]|nr:hypothetical protein [Chlamydiia bacterium]
MEDVINWVVSAPGLIFAVALVVFLVTFVLILKRFISFIVTLILFFLCVGAAYSLIRPKEVTNFLSEHAQNPRLKEWLEHGKNIIEQKTEEVK